MSIIINFHAGFTSVGNLAQIWGSEDRIKVVVLIFEDSGGFLLLILAFLGKIRDK